MKKWNDAPNFDFTRFLDTYSTVMSYFKSRIKSSEFNASILC